MPARFDHLVIAVADLDEAVARWTAAGIHPTRGGAHPVGTVNALVRGPGAAYLELIAAGRDESNPWLNRVRSASGPISWAVAVDDVDEARALLVDAGFEPRPVTEGSRLTPDGDTVAWRMCDVGPGPYDAGLPFLIEWATPMAPGPADGPVVRHLALAPPDPDRVADLLMALGWVGDLSWPRRAFTGVGGGVGITLLPLGEPVPRPGTAFVTVDVPGSSSLPDTFVTLDVSRPDASRWSLDGVLVHAHSDERAHPAYPLLAAVERVFGATRGDLADWPDPHPRGGAPLEEEYSRVRDPGKYRLLGVRVEAWLRVIEEQGLGGVEDVTGDAGRWLADPGPVVRRTSRVSPTRPGAVPLLVARTSTDDAPDHGVVVGAGDPARQVATIPHCGCDACDEGSARLLEELDETMMRLLSAEEDRVSGRAWL